MDEHKKENNYDDKSSFYSVLQKIIKSILCLK